MWFYVFIAILFGYTVVLIAFFMGWCTLMPTRCHPRKEIPFSSVKSPRRNTKYIEIDSVSSSTSLDMFKHIPRKISESQSHAKKKTSLEVPFQPHRYNDYLHPKYSLPPVKIDIEDMQWEYAQLLKTPGRAVRTSVSPSSRHPKESRSCPEL
ncbi:hypothetical protein OSTOST_15531 [Ostertagia ostertagi]